ncbi:MAG: DUF5666 domain-containing protein [Aquincola sp.]|nr:DUF5666 domain-containing protein [Aquincola sp.]
MTSKSRAAIAAAFTAALLAACGGGGGGGIDGTGGGGGGINGTGVAFGTVTGYGSVIVNGVHYDDNGVSITRFDDSKVTGDGAGATTRAALPIGSVVRVDFNSATNVLGFKVDDSISGRIEQVLDDSRIVVMGQTVRIDDTTTKYEDNTLRTGTLALAPGNFVRVQGQPDDKGGLQASFVNKLSASGTLYEVKGVVSNHDGSSSFNVGTLAVSYSASTTTSDMPAASWNGLVVEVKGSCSNAGNTCGTLVATKVEPEGGLSSSTSRAQAEVEGIVLSGTSTSFRIGNVTVNTSGSTRWEGGTQADFAVGVKLEAEGALANGVLTATKVSLRDGSRLEGNVQAPAFSNGVLTFKLTGLPNVTIKANASTALNGLSLNGVVTGQHVRLRGRVASDGTTVVATELEARNADTRLELRGMVTAASGTTLTILGTAVDVNGLSFTDSRGGTSIPMTRDAFLAAAQVGATVKLRSNDNGTSWSEAELESD